MKLNEEEIKYIQNQLFDNWRKLRKEKNYYIDVKEGIVAQIDYDQIIRKYKSIIKDIDREYSLIESIIDKLDSEV